MPSFQWVLSSELHERLVSPLYHTMYGRASQTRVGVLTSVLEDTWRVDVVDPVALRAKFQSVAPRQDIFHKKVSDRVRKPRDQQQFTANRGIIPEFAVGDYLMIARMRNRCGTHKLVSTWTGL